MVSNSCDHDEVMSPTVSFDVDGGSWTNTKIGSAKSANRMALTAKRLSTGMSAK